MRKDGYIYFLLNSSMPGLLKIGYTCDDVESRLASLNTSGVPSPFILGAAFWVSNPSICENKIHKKLLSYRESPNREFFRISLNEALKLGFSDINPMTISLSDTTPEDTVDQSDLLSDEEESIISSIMNSNDNSRTAYDISCILNLDEQKTLLVLGNLKEAKFVKIIRRHGLELYTVTHEGRKYAFERNLYEERRRYY